MAEPHADFGKITEALKRTATVLERAELDYMLGGSIAAWARGGPPTHEDVDWMVRPEHAERALEALTEAGMSAERPPENWLVKVHDGDVPVDLIFGPSGLTLDDEAFARADRFSVLGQPVPVMALEDVLATQLLSLNDHRLEYEVPLQIARSLREQIDWDVLRRRTDGSPYAKAFFTLLEELNIAPRVEG